MVEFVEADGLLLLLDLIAAMDYRARATEEHHNAVRFSESFVTPHNDARHRSKYIHS